MNHVKQRANARRAAEAKRGGCILLQNNDNFGKMDVEKFIECVKKYPILYDTRNKEYKNALKKAEIWELIAREMNVTSDVLRTKWKGLKDGYTKYKKQTKGSTGSAKTYINWCWGPQLAFLDDYIKQRESTSNVYTDSQSQDSRRSSSSSQSALSTESSSQQIAITTTHVPLQSPQDDTSQEQSEPIPSTSATPTSPISTPEPSGSRERESRRRVIAKNSNEDDIDKVLNFMRNKRIKTTDAVDDLFSSYAKTFKKFSVSTQTSIKLELAKIFADAELREHNMNNSPVYSIISVDSDSNQYNVDQLVTTYSPSATIQTAPINLAAPTTTSQMETEYIQYD